MDIVINQKTPSIPPNAEPIDHEGDVFLHLLRCIDDTADSPPMGDLLRRYHGLDGTWLIASPIHWEATHNDAMIVACGDALELDDQRSRELFSVLETFAKEDHITMHYHNASTWLLQCSNKPVIHAKSPHALLHQSMLTHLTSLDDTRYWQKFITEVQMLFTMNPLSKRPQMAYPVNGLWIWGGGALKSTANTPIFCDDHFFKFAQLVSHHVHLDKNPSSLALPEECILLVEQLSDSERMDLEHRFRNRTVSWYWNNRAYRTQPKRWMTRLKEKFLKCL